ncbi:MAG: hypothetical protein OIF40_06270 [Mangrovicoccus sp.]|nr:hypothetical protein [Mangrovicoccus sp.]
MHLEAYDHLRTKIEKHGLTPRLETRIALFISTTKSLNLPFLAMAENAPARSPAWQALNSQLFRECEALNVLMRVTRWAPEPMLYWRNTEIAAPLMTAQLSRRVGLFAPSVASMASFEALAMGHALLATTRLTPIIPETLMLEPFPMALMRIEQENGRLLQTQIRLLKDGFPDIPVETREEIIGRKAEVVDKVFTGFLKDLGA